MNEPSAEILQTWDILKSVAVRTLERKRRLGESAVIWRNGRPLITAGDMAAAEELPGAHQHDQLKHDSRMDETMTHMKSEPQSTATTANRAVHRTRTREQDP